MSKQFTKGRKEFLNNTGHHTVASIAYETTVDNQFLGNESYSWGALYINDCNRVITLSLDLDDKKSYENSVYKVETMISVLQDCLKDMEKVREKTLEINKKAKKKKKKKKK